MAGSRVVPLVVRVCAPVVALALLPALGACTSASPAGTSPATGATSAATGDVRDLPLHEFTLTGSELTLVHAALVELTSRCARRFGVEFTDRRPPDLAVVREADNPRRYGIHDVESARVDGYQPPDDLWGAPAPDGPRWDPSAAELSVVTGRTPDGDLLSAETSPRDGRGRPLPGGGCATEASTALAGGAPVDRTIVDTLQAQSFHDAETDVRVRDLWRAWSDCMAARGHSWSGPWEPNDAPWAPDEREREVLTATDDALCRAELDLNDRWRAVEAEHQERAVQENADALNDLRRRVDARAQRARAVLDEAAG